MDAKNFQTSIDQTNAEFAAVDKSQSRNTKMVIGGMLTLAVALPVAAGGSIPLLAAAIVAAPIGLGVYGLLGLAGEQAPSRLVGARVNEVKAAASAASPEDATQALGQLESASDQISSKTSANMRRGWVAALCVMGSTLSVVGAPVVAAGFIGVAAHQLVQILKDNEKIKDSLQGLGSLRDRLLQGREQGEAPTAPRTGMTI